MLRRLMFSMAILAFSAAAHAQYPAKPVKFVLPYPPGGLTDTFGRVLAEELSSRLGEPVVVENKPGGSLIIGTSAVAKAPADGYTLLMGSSSSLALNVGAFKHLPYDPTTDFSPVTLLFRTPLILTLANSVPARSVKELIAYAKAHPGKLSYASLGYGSSLHIAAERFKEMAGIEMLHVPYKGPSAAFPDLIAGRVSMIFDGGAFLQQAKAGKARLLAVTSAKRLKDLPDVPTLAEAGLPGYEMDFWFGLVAPAGTPQPIVEQLSAEIAAIEKQSSFKKRLAGLPNVQLDTSTPEAMAATIKADIASWGRMLRQYKVAPR